MSRSQGSRGGPRGAKQVPGEQSRSQGSNPTPPNEKNIDATILCLPYAGFLLLYCLELFANFID